MQFIKSDLNKISADRYKALLMDNADFSGYSENGFYPGLPYNLTGSEPRLKKEKSICLAAIFKVEYEYMIERHGSQKAAQEYVRGLPSALHYPFSDHDIIQWMQKELSTTIPEKYHCDAVDKYWQKLGACFSLLVSKYL